MGPNGVYIRDISVALPLVAFSPIGALLSSAGEDAMIVLELDSAMNQGVVSGGLGEGDHGGGPPKLEC